MRVDPSDLRPTSVLPGRTALNLGSATIFRQSVLPSDPSRTRARACVRARACTPEDSGRTVGR